MLAIESPLPLFVGRDGLPLDAGYIYFGTVNLNPVTSPVTVYWDAAGTQPVAQPVRTSRGLIVRSGTPAKVYASGNFSMMVKDSAGAQVVYERNSSEWQVSAYVDDLRSDLASTSDSAKGAGLVGYKLNAATSAGRLLSLKMSEWLSITDFSGVDPTFVSDSTTGIQNAIKFGSWNGTTLWVPNGTYMLNDTLLIGTDGTDNFYSVKLIGESAHGSVFRRPSGAGAGPMITVNGFHNILENFTLISDVNGGNYSASHGIYMRGNPQTGTNGLGTKYNKFSNLQITRVGVGLQIGNYDVDGFDPDIETNSFHALNIDSCNGGVFINGQNILHNPFYNCHVVNCRDYLAKQVRGGDLWFERSYFGGMYDYLTSNYNVSATKKISVTAGVVGFIGCRFEDWASANGNATQRYAIETNGSAMSVIYLAGNVFTTRDNLSTEPTCNFIGSGVAGAVTTKVTLVDNDFGGYVAFDTIDIFSTGNSYRGTGGSTVNGRILSANQKSGAFRDVFMDSNQTMELPGAKFKRNSSVPVIIERPAVATGSEWLGLNYQDEAGLLWVRDGVRVTNGTAAAESAVIVLNARNAGTLRTIGIGLGTAAPVAGTWSAGDRVMNSAPSVGNPKGWICTVGGTPGTWVSEGNL